MCLYIDFVIYIRIFLDEEIRRIINNMMEVGNYLNIWVYLKGICFGKSCE